MLHVVAVDIEHWTIRGAAENVGLASLSVVNIALFGLDFWHVAQRQDPAFVLVGVVLLDVTAYIPCPGANQRSRHNDGRTVDC